MDNETKDTLKKVAQYAEEEKKKLKSRILNVGMYSILVILICFMLFSRETKGYLYGIVPEPICHIIMDIALGAGIVTNVLLCLYNFGILEKLTERKKRRGQS